MYTRNLVLPEKNSFFLFGPRGVGKSTLVKMRYLEAKYIDLLNSRIYQKLLADPSAINDYIPLDWRGQVIIDEVQRVPDLLNEVHRLIENRGVQFVLTGSSVRKLRRQGVNLLAGRAWTYRLYSLSAEEMGEKFELLTALKYGMLPAVQDLETEEEKKKYLDSYIETYLREEVMQEGLTRNLSAFARFLQVASFSVGSMLNVSNVAREVMIERKVVESYFGILDDLMLGVRVPAFSKRAKRKLVKRAKFYLFDAGVYQRLRPRGPLDSDSEVNGVALETLFLQHLNVWIASKNDDYQVSYFRTVSGSEVDFVLYGKDGLWAFEIKSSERFSKSWLAGLRQFGKDYPDAKLYLLYAGEETLYVDGVTIMSIKEMMMKMSEVLS